MPIGLQVISRFTQDKLIKDSERNPVEDTKQISGVGHDLHSAALAHPMLIDSDLFVKLARFIEDCLKYRSKDSIHCLGSVFYSVRLLLATLGEFCNHSGHLLADHQLLNCIRAYCRLLDDLGSNANYTRKYIPALLVDIICMYQFFFAIS